MTIMVQGPQKTHWVINIFPALKGEDFSNESLMFQADTK